MKEKKLKVQVTLKGKALELILGEQKRYQDQDTIRGKNKIINQLLSDFSEIRNTKVTK